MTLRHSLDRPSLSDSALEDGGCIALPIGGGWAPGGRGGAVHRVVRTLNPKIFTVTINVVTSAKRILPPRADKAPISSAHSATKTPSPETRLGGIASTARMTEPTPRYRSNTTCFRSLLCIVRGEGSGSAFRSPLEGDAMLH